MSDLTESFTSFFRKNKKIEPVRPVISMPARFPYGQFQFIITLPKGLTYEALASTDLKTWGTIASNKVDSDRVEFVDGDAAKYRARFYRVACENLVSTTVLGYVAVTAPPGFSMISNPLKAAVNTVEKLFPDVPNGTSLNKFSITLFRLSENHFSNGKWTNPAETLMPGEGAILQNPTSETLKINFVGEVLQGEMTLAIPSGFSIRSSMTPMAGLVQTDLGFPIAAGDAIHLYDREAQKYVIYSFQEGKWDPEQPVIGPGESFWIGKTAAGNWTRNFQIGT